MDLTPFIVMGAVAGLLVSYFGYQARETARYLRMAASSIEQLQCDKIDMEIALSKTMKERDELKLEPGYRESGPLTQDQVAERLHWIADNDPKKLIEWSVELAPFPFRHFSNGLGDTIHLCKVLIKDPSMAIIWKLTWGGQQ